MASLPFRDGKEETRNVNAALLLREIPMILYVSVLRQGIPSDNSLRFLLDSFVLMPFPTSARIVYMLCEQIVIAPLFLRFLQLYLHRRYRSIQKAPGFRRAQMGFMHKTGSAEGVKGATADIRLFSLPPCRVRRRETLCMTKQCLCGNHAKHEKKSPAANPDSGGKSLRCSDIP